MLTIHSGSYLHPESHFPFGYLTRAALKLSDWCRHVGVDFVSETFSLTKWCSLSPWAHSFEFGTLVKFASLQSFLENKSRGDRYIWFDSDIYPSDKAYGWSPEDLPVNGFWGWWHSNPQWVNDPNHRHQYSKFAWADVGPQKRWFSVGSGIFSLSRKSAEDLWAFVNADHSIDSPEWWKRLRERQEATNAKVLALGGDYSHAWMYGLDEHWIEEWVNLSGVQWEEITHEQHSIHRINPDAMLIHYDGVVGSHGKLNYPRMATPNQFEPI